MNTKYFLIQDEDGHNMGVFQYTGDNDIANCLIADIVCGFYQVEDCATSRSFEYDQGSYRPLEMTAEFNDDGEQREETLFIEEIPFYTEAEDTKNKIIDSGNPATFEVYGETILDPTQERGDDFIRSKTPAENYTEHINRFLSHLRYAH